jgi:hypothetical protein
MGVLDILVDSLDYPLRDWWKYLIIGIFLVVLRYIETFESIKPISLFVMFIVWILEIIIFGYFCSVVASTIRHKKDIPSFTFIENVVDGLKYLIVGAVYSIIPLLLLTASFALSGNPNPFGKILTFISPFFTVLGVSTGELSTGFINSLINSPYIFTNVLLFILNIIFVFFFVIAIARMIDMESLKEAFNFTAIIDTMKTIGLEDYGIWFVLFLLYLLVLSCIRILIASIPYIGFVLACLIVIPYTILFAGRSVGLIYKRTKYIGVLNPDLIDPNDESVQIPSFNKKESLHKQALAENARRHNSAIQQTKNLRKNGTVKRTNNLKDSSIASKPVVEAPVSKPSLGSEIVKPSIRVPVSKPTVKKDKEDDYIKPEGKVVINPTVDVEDEPSIKTEFANKEDNVDSEQAKQDALKEIKNLVSDDSVDIDEIINMLENLPDKKKKE